MRLTARETAPFVNMVPDSVRPIRLRAGGLTFAMETAEAIDLATQLADAVTQFKAQEDQS
jgi:hypothetical protein